MQSVFLPSYSALTTPSLLGTRRAQRFESRLFARPATDRLFFAALPDASTADRIADLARRLKIGHGLTGKTLRPEHLHVTLFHVGDSTGLAPERIGRQRHDARRRRRGR